MVVCPLDLLQSILKYCSIITVVRLTSTAFGWEFGISQQYLRFLEFLFQFGERRIEKVESRNKLNRPSCVNLSSKTSVEVQNGAECNGNADQQDPPKPARLRRKIGVGVVAQPPLTLAMSSPTDGAPMQQQQQPKTRRISTPDGPPIFLLDDDDDDSDRENYLSNPLDPLVEMDQSDRDRSGVVNAMTTPHEFHLVDACKFVVRGVGAIIDDQVTKRFTPEELKTWNMLTRTNAKNYQFMSRSLGLFWFVGFLFRYSILLPLRIMFTVTGSLWLICTMSLVGLLPVKWRNKPYRLLSLMSFRMLACGITSRLQFHNRQFKPNNGDICVANHTSPIDAALLACDNCYALVGQRHGGVIGLLESALSRATQHVWFDRGEMRDRQLVTQRLREHISTKTNLPVLIFPEGTCINNSAVMMFRKGSFETTDRICPVAIKYDPRFGDPFWNSSKQTYVQYLLLMMSSWAIKCDVWYMPPMERLTNESPAEFANRVKSEIARQAGLKDLAWDGQLKRSAPKLAWKHQQQEDFANRLKLE